MANHAVDPMAAAAVCLLTAMCTCHTVGGFKTMMTDMVLDVFFGKQVISYTGHVATYQHIQTSLSSKSSI